MIGRRSRPTSRRAWAVWPLCALGLSLHAPRLDAQNPIVPPGVYLADPSARVWEDGRVYVYGSRDEGPSSYCSWGYDVVSSSDLLRWEVRRDVFASKGPGDQVPYSDAPLYAPDCHIRNGTYFLYYCLASRTNTEGVATSPSPSGPFTGGRVIDLAGIEEIDPAVFIDDDGQAYYIWGQFKAKMAKLNADMMSIDPATIKDGVLTESEHFFHEGGSMLKRDGLYYFVYAHMGRGNRPTCLGYATSRSPMGPFAYGGIIVDNDHCDPAVWNNHGSLLEFRGRWYVLYHRSTHGSRTMRKACIEPIAFDGDGRIEEVEMTSQGAGGALEARRAIDAARACLLYGNVRIQGSGPDREELGGIRRGDCAGYKYVDFGTGVGGVTVRVAPGVEPGRIELALDQMWSPAVATVEVPGGGDGTAWTELAAKVKAVRGVHALWLRFRGSGEDLFRVDSFRFGDGPPGPDR